MNDARARPLLLWAIALLLTLSVLYYQRRTGPTRPMRTSFEHAGATWKVRLPRSGTTGTPTRVAIPSPGPDAEARLHWRRYPTNDAFVVVPMEPSEGDLVAHLPSQPAAGKVEYFLTLGAADDRVPGGAAPVLRYKDPVPLGILIPHIVMMSLSILLGFRTGLAVLARAPSSARYAWATVLVLGVGGLILGPLVQLHAFGALWTGWPLGEDLTDNKTAVMWIGWLVAAIVLTRGRGAQAGGRRLVALLALALMLAVVLIPHSARGSQLDYDKLEEGVDPADAIRTGG